MYLVMLKIIVGIVFKNEFKRVIRSCFVQTVNHFNQLLPLSDIGLSRLKFDSVRSQNILFEFFHQEVSEDHSNDS